MITLHPVQATVRGQYGNYERVVAMLMDRDHATELVRRLNEVVRRIKERFPGHGKSRGGKNPVGDWLKKATAQVRQLDPGMPVTGEWPSYAVEPPVFAYAHLDEYLEERNQ